MTETNFRRICFACKRKIEPKPTNNDDILYIDDKFYHKDCFLKEYRPAKHCAKCGKDVFLENADSVKYKNKYYHGTCFEKCCQANTQKWKTARRFVDTYVADARAEYEELITQKKMTDEDLSEYIRAANEKIGEYFAEARLLEYIRNRYNTSNPEYTLIRQVIRGQYKRINTPIPAEHLLEMWQLKANYLDKVYMRNRSLGKEMNITARIRYDLAILVGKYEGYLKWKKSNELVINKVEQETKQEALLTKNCLPQKKHEEVTDVSGYVEDIFG